MSECTSYHILKKVACIQDLGYNYVIDEDGYGVTFIEGLKIKFYQNKYGEIDLSTVEIID